MPYAHVIIYRCIVCGHKFIQWKTIKKHSKEMHGVNAVEEIIIRG